MTYIKCLNCVHFQAKAHQGKHLLCSLGKLILSRKIVINIYRNCAYMLIQPWTNVEMC